MCLCEPALEGRTQPLIDSGGARAHSSAKLACWQIVSAAAVSAVRSPRPMTRRRWLAASRADHSSRHLSYSRARAGAHTRRQRANSIIILRARELGRLRAHCARTVRGVCQLTHVNVSLGSLASPAIRQPRPRGRVRMQSAARGEPEMTSAMHVRVCVHAYVRAVPRYFVRV